MRDHLAAFLLTLVCSQLPAQAPSDIAAAPASHTYSDPLGFSYAIPADWQVVDSKPTLPDVKEQATLSPSSENEKKGAACSQLGLTARHGDPGSVIVQVALPFDCFGRQFTQDDIPGFGAGAAEGLKHNFEFSDPQVTTYTLGTHHVWAERAQGTPVGQPGKHYTIEISCALLSKAAVCWMTMAADPASLAVFENGTVTLDGDSPTPLVPAGTFKQ
jgi:hypothetical protein